MNYIVRKRKRLFENLPSHSVAEQMFRGRNVYTHWLRLGRHLTIVWETDREVPSGDVFGVEERAS